MGTAEPKRAALARSASRYRTSNTERGGLTRLTTARDLVGDFTDRYANPKTRLHYGFELRDLFSATGRRRPSELTDDPAVLPRPPRHRHGGAGGRAPRLTTGARRLAICV